ncbi:MAG: site-2 protease family protein, partial [Sphaerospermopsis kisseleviana]
MLTSSETPIIAAVVLVAFGILGWGFYRARPFGKLGILAWLQSVVLMAPWLVFFGLFAAGIYINIAGVLLLLVLSTGIYIFLGRQLRQAGQDAIIKAKATERLANEALEAQTTPENSDQPVVVAEVKLETITIPEEDLNTIKGIFGIDTFFATETIPYQEGAIFKGNLRGDAEQVHNRLTQRLQERLGDKYRLFLVENTDGKPVMIVLPSRTDPKPMQLSQKAFAVILLVATIATNLEAAGLLLNFDLFANPSRVSEALPIGLGIFTILIAHEIGHWLLAR